MTVPTYLFLKGGNFFHCLAELPVDSQHLLAQIHRPLCPPQPSTSRFVCRMGRGASESEDQLGLVKHQRPFPEQGGGPRLLSPEGRPPPGTCTQESREADAEALLPGTSWSAPTAGGLRVSPVPGTAGALYMGRHLLLWWQCARGGLIRSFKKLFCRHHLWRRHPGRS